MRANMISGMISIILVYFIDLQSAHLRVSLSEIRQPVSFQTFLPIGLWRPHGKKRTSDSCSLTQFYPVRKVSPKTNKIEILAICQADFQNSKNFRTNLKRCEIKFWWGSLRSVFCYSNAGAFKLRKTGWLCNFTQSGAWELKVRILICSYKRSHVKTLRNIFLYILILLNIVGLAVLWR